MGEDVVPIAAWDLFVSYAEVDLGWAEWIAWQLEDMGYRVLVQAWDMVVGADWADRIDRGVSGAARTVAVLSSAYAASVFGRAEWLAAWRADPLGSQRRLIVVRVEECARPGLLAGVVSGDLFGLSEPAARERLRLIIGHAVVGRGKPVGSPPFPPGHRVSVGTVGPSGLLPEVWNLPPRNPNFVGRKKELDGLRSSLLSASVATVQSLHGLGGVGKTQTVVEYAYRHADAFDLVWWVNAEQRSLAAGRLAALGTELGLPPVRDADEAARAVKQELRRRRQYAGRCSQ